MPINEIGVDALLPRSSLDLTICLAFCPSGSSTKLCARHSLPAFSCVNYQTESTQPKGAKSDGSNERSPL